MTPFCPEELAFSALELSEGLLELPELSLLELEEVVVVWKILSRVLNQQLRISAYRRFCSRCCSGLYAINMSASRQALGRDSKKQLWL